MLFGRNYKIGKNHLTEDGITTLCKVRLNDPESSTFPAEIINETTTCELCLTAHDPKWIKHFKRKYQGKKED